MHSKVYHAVFVVSVFLILENINDSKDVDEMFVLVFVFRQHFYKYIMSIISIG
jgi:hypothetical protein